jgi:hypothetical protein
MPYKSVDTIECAFDARGFVTNVEFGLHDGTTEQASVSSVKDQSELHQLNVGEKIKKVETSTVSSKFDIQGGACLDMITGLQVDNASITALGQPNNVFNRD